jgi:hypothetical protein
MAKSRARKDKDGPNSAQIGAAGVQHVAAQMLLNQITPCFPIWDGGYDLVSDYKGALNRVQVKSTTVVERERRHLSVLRFPLYRRRSGVIVAKKYMPVASTPYPADLFDVMIFVNFLRDAVFVVPAASINFKCAYIYLGLDSAWRNAWWVLKNTKQVRAAARKRK